MSLEQELIALRREHNDLLAEYKKLEEHFDKLVDRNRSLADEISSLWQEAVAERGIGKAEHTAAEMRAERAERDHTKYVVSHE